MNYKNLSQFEKYQIHSLMKVQYNITQIAQLLGRDKSSISRDLRRFFEATEPTKPMNLPAMKFVRWYNNEHRYSGFQFVTASHRHERLDLAMLEKRSEVYEKAKAERLLRWKTSLCLTGRELTVCR